MGGLEVSFGVAGEWMSEGVWRRGSEVRFVGAEQLRGEYEVPRQIRMFSLLGSTAKTNDRLSVFTDHVNQQANIPVRQCRFAE
jgi:hypothetical protein